MGYSCRLEAGRTLDAFRDLCVAQTGQANVWKAGDCFYMLEQSNREHTDGAITGRVFRFALGFDPQSREGGKCYPKASVRVNPDGTVARGPAILKQAARVALAQAAETARLERAEMAARAEAQTFFDDHVLFVVVGDPS